MHALAAICEELRARTGNPPLVSVKVSNLLHQELNYEGMVDIFWTDSKVVLGYINNDAKRFHIFVANRVQQIRECTNPNQWRYIESKENPADEASRGLSGQEVISNPRWLSGPAFLWNPEINTSTTKSPPLTEDDPEVKKVKSLATPGTTENVSTILQRLEYFSDWHRAKRAIAVCLKFRKRLRSRTTDREQVKSKTRTNSYQPVNVEQLRQAEVEIIKAIQTEMFPEEMELLRRLKSDPTKREDVKDRKASLKRNSALYRLDPFIDKEGLVRVGGRIKRADVPLHVKHPAILPRKGNITSLIIQHYRQRPRPWNHPERDSRGRVLDHWCNFCSGPSYRRMCHVSEASWYRNRAENGRTSLRSIATCTPFTFCAVDYFGPWHIKKGRKELKRYGVLFTCLSSRANYLDTAKSLETDSFINALRRFLARRGPIRQLRSDQGTNDAC